MNRKKNMDQKLNNLKFEIMAKLINEYHEETIQMNSLINPKSEYIMNCTNSTLLKICKRGLHIIDDLQQICGDEHAEELSNLYDRMELFCKDINVCDTINLQYRNEMRLINKHILQLSCMYNHKINQS